MVTRKSWPHFPNPVGILLAKDVLVGWDEKIELSLGQAEQVAVLNLPQTRLKLALLNPPTQLPPMLHELGGRHNRVATALVRRIIGQIPGHEEIRRGR